MADATKVWTYNYHDIARITGQSVDAVYQHKSRGKFDPDKLETVLIYLAEYAIPTIQDDIVEVAIRGARERHRNSPTSKKTKRKKS